MIIKRRKLFSKASEDGKPKKEKKERSLKGPILGLAVGNLYLSKKLDKPLPKELQAEDNAVKEAIKRKYGGSTKVFELTPDQEKKIIEAAYKKKGKKPPRKVEIPEHFNPRSNQVVLKKGKSTAATLAHELGHRDYRKGAPSGKADILGKVAHQGSNITKSRPLGLANAAVSISSGVKAARKEAQGEKQEGMERYGGTAMSVLRDAPVLGKEIAASRRGLKMMKSVGASKALQGSARRQLITAGGTYATVAGINALGQEALRKGAKTIEKKRIERKKNKESEE